MSRREAWLWIAIGVTGLIATGLVVFSVSKERSRGVPGPMAMESGSKQENRVEWVGHPVVSDNDARMPSTGSLTGVEMGLRDDGVVVWRKK